MTLPIREGIREGIRTADGAEPLGDDPVDDRDRATADFTAYVVREGSSSAH